VHRANHKKRSKHVAKRTQPPPLRARARPSVPTIAASAAIEASAAFVVESHDLSRVFILCRSNDRALSSRRKRVESHFSASCRAAQAAC
jgi:hypothetical protein